VLAVDKKIEHCDSWDDYMESLSDSEKQYRWDWGFESCQWLIQHKSQY
jgi:hypothetical protein